jgi:hypothetical protein
MAVLVLGNFMVVGNTDVTVEHLKVQFVISFVWRDLAFGKVTNFENVNCTGLLQHSSQLLTHSF